eukprot:CAMPEP_0170089480 /NCGR_PEP_ID=MMETSP0019_2-20121128/23536_1 /TAXON_ID=98059 /ORGANISM="Dinobryon sp., Strain UTEXLB2267" /LENGTH=57 /DNA_ID=CAMNT_0010308329 /DNA_START=1452 /DNA_END=1625 /DNA_ORIENTATION=-
MTLHIVIVMTNPGCITPIEAIPTPLLAVPYAAPIFAKQRAAVTPINPKNGADVGHIS